MLKAGKKVASELVKCGGGFPPVLRFPQYISTTGLSRFSVNVSERYVDLYSDTMVVLRCGYKGSVHVSYDSNINNRSTLCAFSLFNVLFCFVYVLVCPYFLIYVVYEISYFKDTVKK